MRVYNLKDHPLVYRGVELGPNGGSAEFAVLDEFVPDRDRELERKRVIALGQLPTWWNDQQRIKAGAAKPARKVIDLPPKPTFFDVAVEVVPKSKKR